MLKKLKSSGPRGIRCFIVYMTLQPQVLHIMLIIYKQQFITKKLSKCGSKGRAEGVTPPPVDSGGLRL